MNSLFRVAILRLTLFLFLGVLAGYQIGNILLGLVFALSAFIFTMLFNYRLFQQWLDLGATTKKPLLNSFWIGIVDQINRIVGKLKEENDKLRADVEFFRDSFQVLDSAVIVIDAKGAIVWANSAALTMLGVNYERDQRELLVNLFRAPAFIKYLNNKQFDDFLIINSPGDASKTLEVQAIPFRQSQVLIFARDISELAQLERVRQDFLANVSHELRTPLTVLTGYLETLKDNASQFPSAWSNVFEQMLEQSNRMDNMVTDVIWLSRLESLPDDEYHDRVPVAGLIQSIISDISVASDKTLSLSMDSRIQSDKPISLLGSYDELHSAFSNLIQNAVKYTGPEGVISVTCYHRGDTFRVNVSDNGEGIDPVHIPRLTERFYRTDESRASSTGGTGLGLAIVKHVLGRHDARLEITSQLGKGSDFICVFPNSRLV